MPDPSETRISWWRLALLTVVGWQASVPLRDSDWGLFGGITFGVHELGHLVFMLTGNEFLTVAGGSLLQLLVPLGAVWLMRERGDVLGVAVAVMWLAASLGNLSWYIGDARELVLPLVSMGGEGDDHDWSYLLRTVDLLEQDTRIARWVRGAGWVALGGALWWGLRHGVRRRTRGLR
jgi:hypothetical protein